MEVVGRTNGGFVRNTEKPSSPPVLLNVSRPTSLGNRCDDAKLVGTGCVCLPSVRDGEGGSEEAPVASKRQDDFNSSLLAEERVVPGAS